MDQPYENAPETAREPAAAAPSPNGSNPLHPVDLEREIRLAVRALEELDMRIKNVQALNLMIFGAIVLLIAYQVREARR